MIIRRHGPDLLLITQPDHAALAGHIMSAWRAGGFPARASRARVLEATRLHDIGWTPLDAAPSVDPSSGDPYEFITAPVEDRRALWFRAIDLLAPRDPYVAALVAQHALTVYRRFAPTAGWETFFPRLEARRDDLFADLAASPAGGGPSGGAGGGADSNAGLPSLDLFLQDYVIVGLGDLFSLIFCNGWCDPYLQEDYRAILHDDARQGGGSGTAVAPAGEAAADGDVVSGGRLIIAPDPFEGADVPLDVPARRIPARRYVSDADLRETFARAPIVRLTGTAAGAPLDGAGE